MTTSPAGLVTRTWLFRILAMLLGLTLALALAEILLRVFHLASAGGLATVTQREFDRVPGIFTPGQRLTDHTLRELPYRIVIDSLGYRDSVELSRSKPAGETRILMLGDSFTFGYLVDQGKTLPALLEGRLRDRCGTDVRVINAGVGGSSIETASEMAARSRGLRINLAVLTFTENDVTDLATPMWPQLTANRAAKSHFPMSVLYPVVRRLALWNLLLEARARFRSRQTAQLPTAPTVSITTSADSIMSRLRLQYSQRLSRLHDDLAKAHIPLVFAIYPSHLSVYGDSPSEQVRWVEQTARQAGITTVNLTPALKSDGRTKEELYLFPYDGHPSPAGYSVVEPVIEDTLAASPLIASHCGMGGTSGSAAPARTNP